MSRPGKKLPTKAQIATYAAGLTRADIAQQYGNCSITFVQDVLSGNKNAPEPFRLMLSQLTGWPVEALFEEPLKGRRLVDAG